MRRASLLPGQGPDQLRGDLLEDAVLVAAAAAPPRFTVDGGPVDGHVVYLGPGGNAVTAGGVALV